MSPRPVRRLGNRPRPRPGGRGGPRRDSNSNNNGGGTAVLQQVERGPVELPAIVSVSELAELLKLPPAQVIKTLISNGVFATQNQEIDYDTAAIVASELGFEVSEKAPLPLDGGPT